MATEAQIQWARFPLIASHSHARVWLQIQANLGLARNTIEAYGRALEDYLKFSSNSSINIEAAAQEHISQYVHHLTNKPQLSETNVRRIDSKAGLANATIQQRLTAVRLYYDYLVEEGIRKTNPVGRGKYTPGKGFAGNRERSLFRRYTKLPWIPNEEQWLQIVQAAKAEPLRNRVMFALAYDSALRREELCSLQIGDINPALRTIVIRAENTKSRWERITPYSQTTSALLANYFNHRKTISRAPGAVFLSESHRNHAQPVSVWTWSKIIEGIAKRATVPQFTTHTLRHLCLTDLARAGWDLHEIAAFAGHRNTQTTLQYIHLSGRELADKLAQSLASIHARRAKLIVEEFI